MGGSRGGYPDTKSGWGVAVRVCLTRLQPGREPQQFCIALFKSLSQYHTASTRRLFLYTCKQLSRLLNGTCNDGYTCVYGLGANEPSAL